MQQAGAVYSQRMACWIQSSACTGVWALLGSFAGELVMSRNNKQHHMPLWCKQEQFIRNAWLVKKQSSACSRRGEYDLFALTVDHSSYWVGFKETHQRFVSRAIRIITQFIFRPNVNNVTATQMPNNSLAINTYTTAAQNLNSCLLHH